MEHTLACLPIPHFVLLPACTATLHLGPPELLRQVELAGRNRGLACLVEAHHYQQGRGLTGCLAQITRVVRQPTGWNVSFRGLQRLALMYELQTDLGPLVHCRQLLEMPWLSGDVPQFPELPEHIQPFRERLGPGPWLDIAALQLPISLEQRQSLLAEPDPNRRAQLLREATRLPRPAPSCNPN
ncbi:MAG: LON peptidase substrate-binding domain-containing protein [Candidatus Eremiobacteraeota bacterium]|nr:LON peptidase substrate-binding domain-containing protein [Candidatus Eremiobacteraeota bacterium]